MRLRVYVLPCFLEFTFSRTMIPPADMRTYLVLQLAFEH